MQKNISNEFNRTFYEKLGEWVNNSEKLLQKAYSVILKGVTKSLPTMVVDHCQGKSRWG